jgi:DNA polymerase III epsilon subunit-like protein
MHKRICIIYTETTGLHTSYEISKKKLYGFARLVALNYEIGYFHKNEFIQEMKVREIVKPRCMYIPPETIPFHGITQEYANNNGTDPEIVIKNFKEHIKEVNIIVSHNVDFHLKTLFAEAIRYNIQLDFSNYLIIDTTTFYHDYGYMKLKDLATKLKFKDIPETNENNLELIKNCFLRLYMRFEKSVKTA